MVARMPKVRCQARTSRSELAFVELTGWTDVRGPLRELGRIVQSQVAEHVVRAHVVVAHVRLAGRLQGRNVPSTLVFRNGSGFAIELSLWDSAA